MIGTPQGIGVRKDRRMLRGLRPFLLAAGTILLGACSATTPGTPPAGVAAAAKTTSADALIAPGRRIVLPQPAELGRVVDARQLVTLQVLGNTAAFETRLSVTATKLSLVCMDTLGRRAITIIWDGKTLDVEVAPWVPEAVKPGSLLADLVLIYWPEKAARAAIAGVGGDVVVSGRSRTIRIDGSDVLKADYGWPAGAPWNGTLRYTNTAWGYTVDVQSVELKPAPGAKG
jgi:Protein of unknown function (DUF3261)